MRTPRCVAVPAIAILILSMTLSNSATRVIAAPPATPGPSGYHLIKTIKPASDGFWDYLTLINERDGGVNGIKLTVEECETQYDTKQGVECYERLKGKGGGATVFNPLSTGITYQLIPKAAVDKIPVHSMGYGMTAAADGRWFPWVFNFPPITGARPPR